MNINDWKTIQLQNDVKYIKRNSIRSSAANWSLVVDVFLLLLAFVLDNIFSESTEQTYNLVWIVIAFLGVLIPIIITVVEFIKLKHHERISRIIMNSKDIVALCQGFLEKHMVIPVKLRFIDILAVIVRRISIEERVHPVIVRDQHLEALLLDDDIPLSEAD